MIAMLMTLAPIVSAENEFVEYWLAENGHVTVKGTAEANSFITVALLKPGVTSADMKNVTTGAELKKSAAYADIITAGADGKYEYEFDAEFEAGAELTLYVTDGKSKFSEKLSSAADMVDFITYHDGAVRVVGQTSYPEDTVTLKIDGIGEGSVTSDDLGNYTYTFGTALGEEQGYELTVSAGRSGKTERHTVRLPEKLYVDPNRSANNETVFAKITDARDYLRENLRDVSVDVIVADGEYKPSEAISFDKRDERTVDTMVTYKSADGGVDINGLKTLNSADFAVVTDESVLSRMYESVRGKVVEIDLKSQGVSDDIINFTKKYDSADKYGLTVRVPTILLNGDRQSLAKWPNTGYYNGAAVQNKGATAEDDQNAQKGEMKLVGDALERSKKWKSADDMYIEGYMFYTYISEWAKIANINDSGIMTLKYRTTSGLGNSAAGCPKWRAVNLLEEIDVPGEWYIDAKTNKLYYYPPHELTSADKIEIAVLADDIIRLENTKYIAFEGLELSGNYDNTFGNGLDYQHNNGIDIKASEHILVSGCYIHDVMADGVCTNAHYSGVVGCGSVRVEDSVIANVGRNGVTFKGGKTATLTPSRHIVTGCDISNVSLSYGGNGFVGIQLSGVGALAEKNTIHSTRTNGILYGGMSHRIRNNELYYNSTETGDSAAIYSGRSWASAGNIIEKNIIHDLAPTGDVGKDRWMIYWDDGLSGNTARQNILVGKDNSYVKAMLISQGPYNTVENNIFAGFGNTPIDTYYIVPEWMGSTVAKNLDNVPYALPIYKRTYPFLADLAALNLSAEDVSARNYAAYRENIKVTGNVGTTETFIDVGSGYDNANAWSNLRNGAAMDVTESGNVTISQSQFVAPSANDYRVAEDVGAAVPKKSTFDLAAVGSDLPVEKYSKLSLTYPSNGAATGAQTVRLDWTQANTADEYFYEVATDAAFANIAASGTTLDTSAEVTLSEDTVYYWRVTAKNKSFLNAFSKTSDGAWFTTSAMPNAASFGTLLAKNSAGETITTVKAGDTVKVYDTVISSKSESVTYIFAAYSADGLVFAHFEDKTVSPSLSEQEVMSFTVPAGADGATFKILRWDGMGTMRPIK